MHAYQYQGDRLNQSLLVWTIGALVLVEVTGCGPRPQEKAATYPVHGKVAFEDGHPLAGGTISFRALDHNDHLNARGSIAPDGTFELMTFKRRDGAVAGRHEVAVTAASRPVKSIGFIPQEPPPPPLIDSRFTDFKTSGIEVIVSPDEDNTPTIIVAPPVSEPEEEEPAASKPEGDRVPG